MQDRIEALADAMMKLNGWDDPASRCYQLRNPLLLRAFSLTRLQLQDELGYRIFDSFHAGYRAGTHDLRMKLQGCSRAKLPPESTLRQLLGVYACGNSPVAVKHVVHWLERALACSDGSVHGGMPMRWFLEGLHSSVMPLEGEQLHA